jgi:hypothetical protein
MPKRPYRGQAADGVTTFDLREYSALIDRSHGSDTLIVAFANAPRARHSTERAAYWGSDFLYKRRLDHISLHGRPETWFRSDIVRNFLTDHTDLPYTRILTYGVSKGGSAALWLAGAARATDVFALVPQVFYDARVLARGDDRWFSASYHDWPEAELRASLGAVQRITLLTDTRNGFERAHLNDLIATQPLCPRVVDMRYAGHDCAAMLGRQRGLARLFDLVLAADQITDLRPITELRKSEAGYYRNLLASRRVASSLLLHGAVMAAAQARGIDPMSARMDSGYRKLGKTGRY